MNCAKLDDPQDICSVDISNQGNAQAASEIKTTGKNIEMVQSSILLWLSLPLTILVDLYFYRAKIFAASILIVTITVRYDVI